jgi:hypothetical protein
MRSRNTCRVSQKGKTTHALFQVANLIERKEHRMPDQTQLKYIVSGNVADLSQVRIANVAKPFEQLTIGELVQLRPGGESADSYNITAVGSDITVSTSSKLAELAQLSAQQAVRSEIAANSVRTALANSQVVAKFNP